MSGRDYIVANDRLFFDVAISVTVIHHSSIMYLLRGRSFPATGGQERLDSHGM